MGILFYWILALIEQWNLSEPVGASVLLLQFEEMKKLLWAHLREASSGSSFFQVTYMCLPSLLDIPAKNLIKHLKEPRVL